MLAVIISVAGLASEGCSFLFPDTPMASASREQARRAGYLRADYQPDKRQVILPGGRKVAIRDGWIERLSFTIAGSPETRYEFSLPDARLEAIYNYSPQWGWIALVNPRTGESSPARRHFARGRTLEFGLQGISDVLKLELLQGDGPASKERRVLDVITFTRVRHE